MSGHHFERERAHHQQLHVDLHTQNRLILPKLSPEERVQHRHNHKSTSITNEGDSLFRLFKDQNTIDLLRHKNINDFKHKASYEKEQDFDVMMREIELQKDEIIKEMKIWTKISESALKGEVRFAQNDYSQLHNAFYKWLLFIEQSYSSYQKIENSLPPPLIHQSPHNLHFNSHYNEQIIKKSPHANHLHLKTERQSQQREIQKLNLMIGDLSADLDVKKVKFIKYENRIQELESQLSDYKGEQVKGEVKDKQLSKKILSIISESEDFLKQLKISITQSKDLKPFLQKLDQKLLILKDYKESFK